MKQARGRAGMRAAALIALLGLLAPAALRAQVEANAALGGRLADSAGRPLALTTVWLVPADTALLSTGTLTDAVGAFGFEGLRPGRYYLRVDRLGYRPEWSDPRQLAAGQRLRLAVTSAPAAVALGGISAPGTCRSGADIAPDTVLATLWAEARKAAAARRLFDLSYRYDVDVRETLAEPGRYGAERRDHKRLVSTPAVARALAAHGAYAGYGVQMDSTRLVAVSEMLDLLDDGFARDHLLCVLPDSHGRRRIHFAPARADSTRPDLAGNIFLDRDYSLRRIEFEYRRGPIAFSRGFVEFGDGGLARSPVRFLSSMRIWLYDAPASQPGKLHVGTYFHRPVPGEEQALVEVRYGSFARTPAR